MIEPIGTTPRKPLTPRQRLALLEEYSHKCALCGLPIEPTESWRDEHLIALGLGGTNKWDNRAPVHIRCAKAKDLVDMAAINRAKNQKVRHYGIKPEGAGKIRSAGFRKFARPSKIGLARIEKPELPPRRGS
jgi:5-methylcytosine-specific restriction endonuclease McrA